MIAWEQQKKDKLRQIIEKYSFRHEAHLPVYSVPSDPSGKPPKYGCTEVMEDFSNNSTIHGIKYMGDRKGHWAERLWWLIAFLLSIYGCSRLIMHIWQRWDRNPVIVSFAEKSTAIYQIPFPAVTFCLETKTQSDLFNYTEMFHIINNVNSGYLKYNFTQEQLHQIDALGQVCEQNIKNTTVGSFFTTRNIVQILEELTPRMPPTLFLCRWHNEQIPCTNIFAQILTEEGICYTFNNLEQKDIFREENLHNDFRYIEASDDPSEHEWSMERGYPQKESLNTYPERVQTAGARAGLSIVLPISTYDKDFICRGPSQGFKIQLHVPGEIPRLSQQFFRLSLDQEMVLSVKPNMITTSRVLKSYNVNRRMCYFQNERYLRFFVFYTQQNCEIECLTNYTLKKCGCVKFSMPRDNNTRMCGSRSLGCVINAEDELLNPYEGLPGDEYGCNCLPGCTAISYDAETSQADFDWRQFLHAHGAVPGSFPG